MSKPRKVLWISCVGEKGGAEVYMLNLLRHLDRSRCEASVVMLRPGPLRADIEGIGLKVHELKSHRMRQLPAVWRAIKEIAGLIRDHQIDIVHSNGFRAHVYGGIASRRTRIPEVWTVHTREQAGLFTNLVLRIPTSHVLANAHRTADWFIERGLPTSLIWPPIDIEKLRQHTPREVLSEKYSIPATGRWIAMGARMQRYKGHEYFIRAIGVLPPEFKDVHGVIIGGTLFGMEASYPDELRKLAAEQGIADRIHFTGFVPDEDLSGLMAASELLMHPALDEDFGLVVAEAQALGKPVLAFASHGPATIVIDGETGRLVQIGDQSGLNKALESMLANPSQSRQMGEAGRRHAEARFGAREAASQLGRVYGALG